MIKNIDNSKWWYKGNKLNRNFIDVLWTLCGFKIMNKKYMVILDYIIQE